MSLVKSIKQKNYLNLNLKNPSNFQNPLSLITVHKATYSSIANSNKYYLALPVNQATIYALEQMTNINNKYFFRWLPMPRMPSKKEQKPTETFKNDEKN